ncbi:MAG: hypothetical protein J2P28_04280 [Actinobacteria bacterium]|nr:hypothetical protein [Actinomycetota bacterium]MBO0834725.1 hypothetical protein [Actinomycetota bacterium]
MASNKKKVYAGFTGMAAAGLGIAGFAAAAPAAVAAASTWDVTNGGHYTAHNTNTNVFHDVTGNQTISCPVSTVSASGAIKSGKSVSNPIGTVSKFIAGTTTAPCSGPFGLKFAGTGSQFPWHLNASKSSTPTSHPQGVITGSLSGIHVHAAALPGGITSCSFSVSGKVPGKYYNSTGILSVLNSKSSLHITNVHGCAGLIKSSDKATYAGLLSIKTGPNGSLHPTIHHNIS